MQPQCFRSMDCVKYSVGLKRQTKGPVAQLGGWRRLNNGFPLNGSCGLCLTPSAIRPDAPQAFHFFVKLVADYCLPYAVFYIISLLLLQISARQSPIYYFIICYPATLFRTGCKIVEEGSKERFLSFKTPTFSFENQLLVGVQCSHQFKSMVCQTSSWLKDQDVSLYTKPTGPKRQYRIHVYGGRGSWVFFGMSSTYPIGWGTSTSLHLPPSLICA